VSATKSHLLGTKGIDRDMQRIHCCSYPYVTHSAHSMKLNGKDVCIEEVSLDARYSGAPRCYLEQRCALVHVNVQQHMSTDACAFCLAPYGNEAHCGRWDVMVACPMYAEMHIGRGDEDRSLYVCTECREKAVYDVYGHPSGNILVKFLGDCAFFWVDSYSGLNY
jgi:hypothetical protein